MNRDERLQTIQDVHDKFIEGTSQFPEPSGDTLQFPDANQFSADTALPQDEFVDEVERTVNPQPPEKMASAIEHLEGLLAKLKTEAETLHSRSSSSGSEGTASESQ